MSKLQSFIDLQNYCLEMNGHGVIDLEITSKQIKNRIEQAIDYYVERHYNGVEKSYIIYCVTQDDIDSNTILIGDKIRSIVNVSYGTGGIGRNGGISVDGFGYVNPPNIQDTFVYNMNSGNSGSSMSLSYSINKSTYELINNLYNPTVDFDFNEYTGRLSINGHNFKLNQVILIEAYASLEPCDFKNIYNETFIKEYSTALIKLQVGINTKKYRGVKLAGGAEIDGQQLYDEAKEEIRELQEQFEEKYEYLPMMLIG